ncbi:unnamed protein product [Adineta ricciae]|uniref:Uncharacterized protein n=1 Tax=Adineta ricciae TaxID=249248 RepID=A0A814D4X9_ADIRI|nr:unnamed protein product [Adineta ricciae]
MHCISWLAFVLVIYICQAQPVTETHWSIDDDHYKYDATEAETHQTILHVSTAENPLDHTVQTSASHEPIEIQVQFDKDARQSVKLVYNSGSRNYCYCVLPFILATLVGMLQF